MVWRSRSCNYTPVSRRPIQFNAANHFRTITNLTPLMAGTKDGWRKKRGGLERARLVFYAFKMSRVTPVRVGVRGVG